MAKRKFQTSLKSLGRAYTSVPESEFGPSLVEPGESLPVHMMVERLMDAGVQLSVHRAMERLYHVGPDGTIPDEFLDPTQEFSFNYARAFEVKKWVEAKIRGDKKAMEKAKEEAAAKNAEDKANSSGEPDPPVDEPPAT